MIAMRHQLVFPFSVLVHPPDRPDKTVFVRPHWRRPPGLGIHEPKRELRSRMLSTTKMEGLNN